MAKDRQKSGSPRGKGADSRHKDEVAAIGLSPRRLATLLIVIVVLLSMNSVLLVALLLDGTAKPAVLTIDSEDDVYLELENVVNGSYMYRIWVSLKNTGGKIAYVSATGEILVSLYGSAYGEEVKQVLDYVSMSISPGESRWLYFGTFTTSSGWHYVIHIHISWNGGSLELTRLVS